MSFAHHIKKLPHLHPQLSDLSINDIITYLIDSNFSKKAKINNIQPYNLGSFFVDQYLPWMKLSNILTISFENLVGSKGGGTDYKQYMEIKKIGRHLGLDLQKNEIEGIAQNLFGEAQTFRKGLIGSWKKEFTKEHIRLWKNNSNLCKLLIDLGYEKNLLW